MTKRLARIGQRLRGRHLFVLDLANLAVAQIVAVTITWGALPAPRLVPAFPLVAIVVIAARTGVNTALGLYSRRWRYASVRDLERIALAAVAGSGVALAACLPLALLDPTMREAVPWSYWPTELLLALSMLGGARFGIRAISELATAGDGNGSHGRLALLYGAGEVGALVARWSSRHPDLDVQPVGFLDDDPALARDLVADLPVFGGLDALDSAVQSTGATSVLITMPSAAGTVVRRIVDAAIARHLTVSTVPALGELLDGSFDVQRIRSVRVEDLLRRPIVDGHAAGFEELITGQTVLITGAAGSIGSELARQVLAGRPSRLVLVDRAESPLYMLERELVARREHGGGDGEIVAHLRNVASRGLMSDLVASERPRVIFHAAAYKHVPLMEDHPSEAVHVNVGGTLAVLDAAMASGVERFVLVSTDKAVRPSCAMGASKRIAELLVAEAARRADRPYVSVRFGNVLNSTGSVIPIFREQLEAGQPLTITDPRMTRFFMTIPEAAWLILDAAALGRPGGDLFVLDMGEPVRIIDLARDLVRLAGHDPDSQPIEYVGLRPGEKLHEQLTYDAEHAEPTSSDKVLRLTGTPPPATLRADVRRLIGLATGQDEARLREVLLDYVGAIEPQPAGERDDRCVGEWGIRAAFLDAGSPADRIGEPAGVP